MKTTGLKKQQLMLQKNHKECNKQFFAAIKECVSNNKEIYKYGFIFQEKKV